MCDLLRLKAEPGRLQGLMDAACLAVKGLMAEKQGHNGASWLLIKLSVARFQTPQAPNKGGKLNFDQICMTGWPGIL